MCALPRSIVHTAPATITIYGAPRQKGHGLVFCERWPLSIGIRSPCFQVLCEWMLLGADAKCHHILVPQAGLGSVWLLLFCGFGWAVSVYAPWM